MLALPALRSSPCASALLLLLKACDAPAACLPAARPRSPSNDVGRTLMTGLRERVICVQHRQPICSVAAICILQRHSAGFSLVLCIGQQQHRQGSVRSVKLNRRVTGTVTGWGESHGKRWRDSDCEMHIRCGAVRSGYCKIGQKCTQGNCMQWELNAVGINAVVETAQKRLPMKLNVWLYKMAGWPAGHHKGLLSWTPAGLLPGCLPPQQQRCAFHTQAGGKVRQ